MKHHLSTDAGKELTEKIGLVYQIKVSPKKLGFEEVTCIVDLKKGEVTKVGGRGAMKIKGSLSAAQEVHP
ncbi:hypothetical protein YC2023_009965 [Brassica napus]